MVGKIAARSKLPLSPKTEIGVILIIAALWIVMALAVNPSGNFPLNDDWSYGRAVQRLLATGRYQPPEWSAMNHIAHIYWGALFCLPFGFSFTALRISTLVMGAMGVLGIYGLLREVNGGRSVSVFGALLIMVNPIYFGLSNTFMSDVPFFALTVSSVWLFVGGVRRASAPAVGAAYALAAVALLIRQSGLAIFIGFGASAFFQEGGWPKKIRRAVLPIALGFSLQILYQAWLTSTGRFAPFFGSPASDLSKIFRAEVLAALVEYLKLGLEAAIYSGMFLFPCIALLGWRSFGHLLPQQRRWPLAWILAFSVVTLGAFIRWDIWMPFTNHVMFDIGLGPLLLRDSTFGPTSFPAPPAIGILWKALTAVGVIGAAFCFYFIFIAVRELVSRRPKIALPEKWLTVFCLTAMAVYFVAMVTRGFFDRYLLPLWPLFLLLISARETRGREGRRDPRAVLVLGVIIVVLFASFALGATHDYLLWNRVRWDALNRLMTQSRISPKAIDGGLEFNAWYLFDLAYRPVPGKSWWWVEGDDYVIAFARLKGYSVAQRFPLKRWLPFGPRSIVVLRRTESGPAK
jgi:hypothetical protein